MNILSLFANVGIGETYISEHVKLANELLPERCEMYEFLHPNTEVVCGDITNVDVYKQIIERARFHKCDFILATPPCQGFSVAGKQDKNDPRNTLTLKVIDAINDLNPNYVLIENVPGALKSNIIFNDKEINLLECIKNNISKEYKIKASVLDCADYGTPQYRKRAIILISKDEWNFPEKQPQITVEAAIGHLPPLESNEKSHIKYHHALKHNARHISWMKHTPTGKTAFENYGKNEFYPQLEDGVKIKGFATTYKRIYWDKPACTITMCNAGISSQNNVHPGRLLPDGTYSDARVLSLKELMILTGLPEDYVWPEVSEGLIRKVIGEAVPPILIKKLIDMI